MGGVAKDLIQKINVLKNQEMELGAKNGTRTRDPDLGKVVLYQLSYFRKIFNVL